MILLAKANLTVGWALKRHTLCSLIVVIRSYAAAEVENLRRVGQRLAGEASKNVVAQMGFTQ